MMLGFVLVGSLGAVPADAGAARFVQPAQHIQQQEEQRRQDLRKKSLEDQLKKPRERADRLRDPERAQLLYRNMVLEQGLTHEQALDALARAGYPTAGIKRLP